MDYFRLLYFFILISVSLSTQSGSSHHESTQSAQHHGATQPPWIKRAPKMVAFDLDFTLWPFWIDVDVIPPFHKDEVGDIVDVNGKRIKYYRDVPNVLRFLNDNQIIISIFAKTYDIDGSKQLLDVFGFKKYISHVHLFSGSSRETYINITNIEALGREADVDIKEILFIDDLYRDITDFELLEIPSYLAHRGVTMEVLKLALKKFADFPERITDK